MPWILDLALMIWFFKASGVKCLKHSIKVVKIPLKDAESDLLLVGNVISFCWSDRNMTLTLKYGSNMLKSSLICRFPAQILTLAFLYCNVRPPLHSSRASLRFAAFLPAAPPTTSAFSCCQSLVVFCCFLCSCLIQVTLTSERPRLAPAALCVHPGLVNLCKHSRRFNVWFLPTVIWFCLLAAVPSMKRYFPTVNPQFYFDPI